MHKKRNDRSDYFTKLKQVFLVQYINCKVGKMRKYGVLLKQSLQPSRRNLIVNNDAF